LKHVSANSPSKTIAQLAQNASVEINVQDVKHLAASRPLLPPGSRIYISHLPKQAWQETREACRAVREAGFEPVPHIPVRLIEDSRALEGMLKGLVEEARIAELLLISGDYPNAAGPYSTVEQVLLTGALQQHGLTRVSIAGHPGGHPKVTLSEIRLAERRKALLAGGEGLQVTLVTQFFFEHLPFVSWVNELRAQDIHARIVGGLAGPASLPTLLKFATRCGVGPSIRALGARPTSLTRLLADHGPEQVLRGLAEVHDRGECEFTGIHLFCFGGFLRTCEWLSRVARGQFELTEHSFTV
jgi:methylenetetrahydrofolate reductase (NADPH)